MNEKSFKKAFLLMLFIAVAVVASWEIYLRNQGLTPYYDDNAALWSHQRARVYQKESVVFIGSSRIKYDLDIPTWEKRTGKQAVQLAMTGSNPRSILEDLANDTRFKGNMVIDVTEFLFFNEAPNFNRKPHTNLSYFHDETPAQKASFQINKILEAQFVFLDKEYFSINAKLDALQLQNRPGIFVMPTFPVGFEMTNFNEQATMSPKFVADTMMQNQMRNIWHMIMGGPPPPPMSEATIKALLASVKKNTDKIKSRGGHVVFVRTPSSGKIWQGEQMGFPKEKFWNRLLEETGSVGFHFAENPVTKNLICIEESHLAPKDAIVYTKELIVSLSETPILKTDKTK